MVGIGRNVQINIAMYAAFRGYVLAHFDAIHVVKVHVVYMLPYMSCYIESQVNIINTESRDFCAWNSRLLSAAFSINTAAAAAAKLMWADPPHERQSSGTPTLCHIVCVCVCSVYGRLRFMSIRTPNPLFRALLDV